MAITLIGSPPVWTPAYNPVYWYFDSTNKTKPGFRYVVDVVAVTAPTLTIKRVRIIPGPDGYGIVELSKTLQSFLTAESPTTDSLIVASKSHIQYYLKVSEEYEEPWVYTNEAWDDFGRIYFYNTTPGAPSPTFSIGDTVSVTQNDGGAFFPMVEGIQTVADLGPLTDEITLSVIVDDFPLPSTIGGAVNIAGGSKTLFPDLYTSDTYMAFNAAWRHTLSKDYTTAEITLSSVTPPNLITGLPLEFRAFYSSVLTANVVKTLDQSEVSLFLYFSNNLPTPTVRRVAIIGNVNELVALPVGPANLPTTSLVSGSGNILQDDVTEYTFWVATITNIKLSETYKILLQEHCTDYDVYDVIFLDRKGALGCFGFSYGSTVTHTTERTNFKKLLGELTELTSWSYQAEDSGNTPLSVNDFQSLSLTTAWLTQDEANYFIELLTSPLLYFAQTDEEFFPALVTTSTFEERSLALDNNLRYTIEIAYANNDSINW